MMQRRDWKNDFSEIRQCSGGYFHQDFAIMNGSVEGTLAAALRDNSDDEKRALISELTTFLAIPMTEKDRLALLYGPLGCDYYVEADGYTATTWLRYVKRRFEESLAVR